VPALASGYAGSHREIGSKRNNGVRYLVCPGALVITQGSCVLSNEPIFEYWSG
jgi:hypothetical protein